nr:MAG TPA: hypothetical protein [Caudoviricetes sp.]
MNPEYRHGLWDFLLKKFSLAKHTPYPRVASPSRGGVWIKVEVGEEVR